MRIGVSTASFYGNESTEEAIDRIHVLDVDTLEIFLDTFSEYRRDFARMLKRQAQSYNMRVHSVHAMCTQFEPQLFSRNARQRQDAQMWYEKVLRAARELGAQCYVFHGPSSLYGQQNRMNMDYGLVADVLNDCSERAKKHGVTFTVENVHYCLFYRPEFVQDLYRHGAKNIAFTLDVKQAARSKRDVAEYIDAMGDHLMNVHVCDFQMYDGGVRMCMPGTGEANFPDIYKRLLQRGYNGPIILEVYAENYRNWQELQRGLAYIQATFNP